MNKGRLEAFSDGVIAIIITIMVLELKVPQGESLRALLPLAARLPQLRPELRLRRHLLEQSPPHAARHRARHRSHALGKPSSVVLALALSVRHRMDGRKPLRARCPSALYGLVLLMAAIAYWILQQLIIAAEGPASRSQKGGRQRLEGKTFSPALCVRHRPQPPLAVARPGDLRPGRAAVARPRPPHRARPEANRNITPPQSSILLVARPVRFIARNCPVSFALTLFSGERLAKAFRSTVCHVVCRNPSECSKPLDVVATHPAAHYASGFQAFHRWRGGL